jgi:hypothetical protein
MAKLFQGEQNKIGQLMGELPMGELPMGEPPWGSGAEQGCPNKGSTGWTYPSRNWRRAADRDGPLRGSVPDPAGPSISGPTRSIKMYSCIQICYVKGISVV